MVRYWLIAERAKAGLTQSEVAERAGIRRETYLRTENGKTTPHEATKVRIANAIGFEYEKWREEE